MITYYNTRPGEGIKLKPDNLPGRRARWTVQVNKNGRKWLEAEDAQEISDKLRTESHETLRNIAHELNVSPEFLRVMLAAHGHMLKFHYKAG